MLTHARFKGVIEMKPFLLILFSLMSISFASAEVEINEYELGLEWLETANSEADANAAISKGDLRIKCVMGYALRCPGVKERAGLEYTVIEGTGDVVTSERHEKLLKLATKYAKDYNSYIKRAKDIEKAQ